MFIDTSVIVALLASEPEAAAYADRIAGARTRLTSGLVILELREGERGRVDAGREGKVSIVVAPSIRLRDGV